MYYNVKALILRSRVSGEADKTVTAYTFEWGKVSLIVPSAKKVAAKLSSATEPVTEAELSVYMPFENARGKVTGGVIINNHTPLKNSFNRGVFALYASEIAEKLVPLLVPNETKYFLISRVWEILEASNSPFKVLAAFTLRLLKISGYNFTDYLLNSKTPCEKTMFNAVKQLSSCAGEQAEHVFCPDEKLLWNYVESYLLNYIKLPAVSVFLKKLNYKIV